MKRSSARLLLAALAAVGVVALGYRFWLRDRPGAAASAQPTAGSVAVADGLVAAIYFPSTSGMLAPEPRTPPANL
ncbi:MAG: hypothetical protein OEW19_20810, partial [Acidobacteriota bacterium]|nr:hypothetical protein [Acidobacteriota bacterium]